MNAPSLLDLARKEIVRTQIDRFRHLYSSYFDQPETIRMATFFFEKVYNLEEKAEWEDMALKTYGKVKHMIKETSRENMERLIELNHLTDTLDFAMGELLISKGWDGNTKLQKVEYDSLYSELGRKSERERQLTIVLLNLQKVYELAHKPIASAVMKPASVISKMLGVYPLFRKIEEGYEATLHVTRSTFDSFFKFVEDKEWLYIKERFENK